MTARMQQRRDTAANWTSNNPTLAAGEIGYESDTAKFKIGTGSTIWASLAYALDTITASSSTTFTNKTISATTNTLSGVINNTLTTTTGDMIYASGANTPARLGIGTAGQTLIVSAGGIPEWGTAAAGGVAANDQAFAFAVQVFA